MKTTAGGAWDSSGEACLTTLLVWLGPLFSIGTCRHSYDMRLVKPPPSNLKMLDSAPMWHSVRRSMGRGSQKCSSYSSCALLHLRCMSKVGKACACKPCMRSRVLARVQVAWKRAPKRACLCEPKECVHDSYNFPCSRRNLRIGVVGGLWNRELAHFRGSATPRLAQSLHYPSISSSSHKGDSVAVQSAPSVFAAHRVFLTLGCSFGLRRVAHKITWFLSVLTVPKGTNGNV